MSFSNLSLFVNRTPVNENSKKRKLLLTSINSIINSRIPQQILNQNSNLKVNHNDESQEKTYNLLKQIKETSRNEKYIEKNHNYSCLSTHGKIILPIIKTKIQVLKSKDNPSLDNDIVNRFENQGIMMERKHSNMVEKKSQKKSDIIENSAKVSFYNSNCYPEVIQKYVTSRLKLSSLNSRILYKIEKPLEINRYKEDCNNSISIFENERQFQFPISKQNEIDNSQIDLDNYNLNNEINYKRIKEDQTLQEFKELDDGYDEEQYANRN